MTQKERSVPKSAKVVLVYVLAILLEFAVVNAYLASAITVSSGVWSGAPSYTVWKEGSTYYAKSAYGVTISSTNATYIVQSVQTSSGAIFFKAGTYIFPRGIKILRSEIAFLGEIKGSTGTVFQLGNNVDEDLISADSVMYEFYMKDIYLNGNKANNALGNGIDFTWLVGRFENLYAYRWAENGFYSEGMGSYFFGCHSGENGLNGFCTMNGYGSRFLWSSTRANGLHGFYFTSNGTIGTGDIQMVGCETDTETLDGVYITGVNSVRFYISELISLNNLGNGLTIADNSGFVDISNSDFNANDGYGIEVNHASLCSLGNCHTSGNNLDGVRIWNSSSYISMNGGESSANSQASLGTYDGIHINTSSDCTINAVMVRSYDEIHNYGIRVTGTSPDRNLIIGCHVTDAKDDKNIAIIGASTYVVHSYNGSTWISEYP